MERDFVKKYLEDFSNLVKPNKDISEKIIKVKNILIETNKKNKKIMIFGNGGSAAIASHFSVDLTKNAKIRCFNFDNCLDFNLFKSSNFLNKLGTQKTTFTSLFSLKYTKGFIL